MTSPDRPRVLSQIPASIWALGFVSLFMDVSSELIHSLLPVFMVSVLGASALTVGLLEGVAEATALLVKVFSGPLSDYLGKRKALAVIGYGLGALSKPLFALAPGVGLLFAARFLDRIGKGIRGAPRDALVADLTPPALRGAAYGLRQALDTVGAFSGPLLAIGLMLLWQNQFRWVFWVAVLPAVLSVLLLLVAVREPARSVDVKRVPLHWRELRRLSGGYWWVVAVGAVFTLARFSEAFLVLRAQRAGLPLAWIPLVLVAMNAVYALSAYPLGKLADTLPPGRLLAGGLLLLIAADLVLAYGPNLPMLFMGIALWGLHMGATQGLLASLVANAAPADLRGTAFGCFNLLSGLALLVASGLAGWLWEQLGPAATFQAGAIFGGLALAGLLITPPAARPANSG